MGEDRVLRIKEAKSEIPCRVNISSSLVGENSPEYCGDAIQVNWLITVKPQKYRGNTVGRSEGFRTPVTTDSKEEV